MLHLLYRWFLLANTPTAAAASLPPALPPGECQPKNGPHRNQPQWHIIAPMEPGKNGTAWPMGLNDANAVFQHRGVFHVMHQCDGATVGGPCGGGHEGRLPRPSPNQQSFWHSWGHVVSRDGARWRRLPDALTPTPTGVDHGAVCDGAVSFPDDNLPPVMTYGQGCGFYFPKGVEPPAGIARPSNTTDDLLTHWTKHQPLTFAPGSPSCFIPGRIWRDRHGVFNMVCITGGLKPPFSHTLPDARYTTTNASLQGPWTLADPHFAGNIHGLSGSVMFLPLPSPGSAQPSHILSSGGGGNFAVGIYNETTGKFAAGGDFDVAPGVAFSAAGLAEDKRVLYAGWVPAGRDPHRDKRCLSPSVSWLGQDCGIQTISCIREITWDAQAHILRANPLKEYALLHNHTLLPATNLTLQAGQEQPLQLLGSGAAMDLRVTFTLPNNTDSSFGIRVLGALWTFTVSAPQGGLRTGKAGTSNFPVLPHETSVDVRVLVDRSIAEFFVARGRATGTIRAYPNTDTGASLLSTSHDAHARAEAFEMGCGWEGQQ